MDTLNTTFEATKRLFGDAVSGLQNLEQEHLPEQVRKRIEEHPAMTAVELLLLLLTACPMLVWIPGLSAVGFGWIGPSGGWLAPAYQSRFGATLAFRMLQSARMGGDGAVLLNRAVQGSAVASAAALELRQWCEAADKNGLSQALCQHLGMERAKL